MASKPSGGGWPRPNMAKAAREYVAELARAVPVHFCAGDYCPGYHWPASNTPHPTSCAQERLNSADNLREAAASRRAHGRAVKWEPLSGHP